MNKLNQKTRDIPWGLIIIFSAIFLGTLYSMWDSLVDPNWKSGYQLEKEEKEKVRNMSCSELKNYVLLGLDGNYRPHHQSSLAKELFTWKCEK